MRFFSLKFLKKTLSELELVTWEPECVIELDDDNQRKHLTVEEILNYYPTSANI